MRIPSKDYIEHLREKHPEGSRVQLVTLNDPYSKLKPGECGVLRLIDSLGTYHIDWDSGSGLGLVPGEDSFNILPPATTTLKLYMPMTLEQYERNQWGDYEGEPVEIPAYDIASEKYSQLGNSEYETRRLRELFERAIPMTKLDAGIIKASISKVVIDGDKVSVLLKNGQTISLEDFA